MFHFIASTGRTATTFLAAFLDTLDGVTACHEGYPGSDKNADPILPLINLENALCYRKPSAAREVVENKRSPLQIEKALAVYGSHTLVDVAYYNPVIARALLQQHPEGRMVAIIRDCAGFVRSATCLEGEDPLPVGWPAPEKALTEREKFIAMGRIKPARGTVEHDAWGHWSAICRNIWLWRETNRILLETVHAFPDRATVLDFRQLGNNRSAFLGALLDALSLSRPDNLDALAAACMDKQNSKPSGYQIPAPPEWTGEEQDMLARAQQQINEMYEHVPTH